MQSRGLFCPACLFGLRRETSGCSRENPANDTMTSLSDEDIVIDRTRKLMEMKTWVECFESSCAIARLYSHSNKPMHIPFSSHLEHQCSTLCLLVASASQPLLACLQPHNVILLTRHTLIRNACTASAPIVLLSCNLYTPVVTPLSS